MAEVYAEHQQEMPSRGRRDWRVHLSWTTLIILGWVLYELTSQPALGAGVACAKFGWSDLRAAFWLRRVDPDRQRGTVCFWWYVTFALWKVAVMAVLAAFVISFISAACDGPPNPAMPRKPVSPVLHGIAGAMGVGFGLSLLSSYVAMWIALRKGISVWLGSAPHRARTERYWPPCEGKVNFAFYVTFTTLILSIPLISGLVVGAILLLDAPRPGPWGAFAVLTLTLFTIGALIVAFPAVTRRVVAQTPQECWPFHPGEVAREVAEVLS
jgi:hypothetical protein